MAILRYLFGLFRCHGTHRQVIFSICIGAMIGIVYGVNESYLLFLPLLLLFRVSIPYVALTAVVFFIANELWLKPIIFDIGMYALGANNSWSFTLENITQFPIIVFLGLDTYMGFGSWALGVLVFVTLFIVAYVVYWALANSKLAVFLQNNKFSEKVNNRFWKNKEVTGNKILRPQLTIYVLLFLVLGLAFLSLCSGIITKWYIREYASKNLDCPIKIGDASFNFLSGKLLISHLEISDPENTSKNLLEVDFVEIDFLLSSLIDKQWKIDHLNLSGVNIYLTKKEGLFNVQRILFSAQENNPALANYDWLQSLQLLFESVLETQQQTQQKKIKLIEDYIYLNTPKNPQSIQALLQITGSDRLQDLAALNEEDILYRVGKPRYIKDKPLWFLHNVSVEKCKLIFNDQDKNIEKSIEIAWKIRNFHFPSQPLFPIEFALKAKNIDISNSDFLYKNSSNVWLTEGELSLLLTLQYDQGNFHGEGEAMVKGGKLQSTENSEIFNVKSSEFIWGLNKAENFSTPFSFHGNLSNWNLDIPEEPLLNVSRTANSNFKENR